MAVAHKEIGIQLAQIQRNLPNAVGTVNQTENAVLLAHLGDPFERETNSRYGYDGFEKTDLRIQSIVQDPRYGLRQRIEDLRMCAGKRIGKVLSMSHLAQLNLRVGLHDGSQRFLTGSINGVEIDDAVFLLVLEVA